MERRGYEKQHGGVSAGELFRLVVDDPRFSWLHNISEFVVRIDEALSNDEDVTNTDSHVAIALARKIFAPSENGDGFQKKYFDAIQKDPSVVIEHAELARLFHQRAHRPLNRMTPTFYWLVTFAWPKLHAERISFHASQEVSSNASFA